MKNPIINFSIMLPFNPPQAGMPLPPSVYIYGESGAGKSTVIESVLTALEVDTCTVNCIEMCTPQLIFQTAINKFSGWLSTQRINRKHLSSY